jgi:hypothetical protein
MVSEPMLTTPQKNVSKSAQINLGLTQQISPKNVSSDVQPVHMDKTTLVNVLLSVEIGTHSLMIQPLFVSATVLLTPLPITSQ